MHGNQDTSRGYDQNVVVVAADTSPPNYGAIEPVQHLGKASSSCADGDRPTEVAINVNQECPQRDNSYTTIGDNNLKTYLRYTEKSIKMGFIRKVYAILTLQLLITFGTICLFIFCQPIRLFCTTNWWMILVSMGVFILALILVYFTVDFRRRYPYNFIFLFLFTCCESFAVATLTTYFAVNEVLLAFGCTMIITIGITVFTLQSKWDFTFGVVAIYMLIWFALSFGILCGFYYGYGWNYHCIISYNYFLEDYVVICYQSSNWYIVSCAFGVLLFSLFLIIDTQWMLDGSHKYEVASEEYIFASLNLYIDIMMIFMYILLLNGNR